MILDGVCVLLNEMIHFRAVTLSTALYTMSAKTIRLVQAIKDKFDIKSALTLFQENKNRHMY